MGLRGYDGERPGFLGGTNATCECRAYCCSPMATYTHPLCSSPNPEYNLIASETHYLWISIRDKNVVLQWACVSGLCVNDSQILSMVGVDTTTMMAYFLV